MEEACNLDRSPVIEMYGVSELLERQKNSETIRRESQSLSTVLFNKLVQVTWDERRGNNLAEAVLEDAELEDLTDKIKTITKVPN